MKWSKEHDVILCREILTAEPFKYKTGSRERGQSWDRVAEALNSIQNPRFVVKKRAVRERYSVIESAFKKKDKEEIRATGISPELSEVDEAIEDIINQFSYWEEQFKTMSDEKLQKTQDDQGKAEEMRLQAMERQGQTNKRKSEDQPKTKRQRSSSTETIQFLQEKAKNDVEMRKEELALKRSVQENAQLQQTMVFDQQKTMFQYFQAQQEQQAQQQKQMQEITMAMLQQQQLQNQAFMSVLAKLNEK